MKLRPRIRPLALGLALALTVGGLAVAPVTVVGASAASNAANASSVLDKLNAYRTAAGIPGFKRSSNLQANAQDIAAYYAAHNGFDGFNPNDMSTPPPAADTQSFPYRIAGSGAKAVAAVAAKHRKFSADTNSTAFLFDKTLNYAGAGFVTKGNYTYVLIVQTRYTAPPQVTVVPKIAGTRAVGQKVTATFAGWTPKPADPKFQWYADYVAISGAKSSSLSITTALLGKRLSVKVAAAASGYLSGGRESAATATVVRGTIAAKQPVVAGKRVVGSTLTVTAGNWGSGVTYSYQWLRNGVLIKGETRATHKLVAADAGKRIDARVIGMRTGYNTARLTTSTAAKTFAAFATVKPVISGSAKTVGNRLTVKPGTWTPRPTSIAYSWKRDGKTIAKATGTVYAVTKADVGHKITVTVTGARSGYRTVTLTSAAASAK